MEEIDYPGLEAVLDGKQEAAIVLHSDPDPDAIGSGLGKQLLLKERFGIKSEIFYSGQISHPENKSLVELVGIKLNHIDSFDKEKYQGNVVLVDCARSDLVENPLVVIDHHEHEKEEEVKAQFKHIDKKVGACVTIVINMLSHYEVELDKQKHRHIITALAHGFRADTNKFLKNTSQEDLAAYSSLHPLIDYEALRKIEHPPKSLITYKTWANAINNWEDKNSYLISGVGITTEGDAIPIAADDLLERQGINTTIIYGIVDDCVRSSLRTTDQTVNTRELAEIIFGKEFAGGHSTAAGAKVPLRHYGDLLELEENEVYDVISKLTLTRFYKAIKTKKDEK